MTLRQAAGFVEILPSSILFDLLLLVKLFEKLCGVCFSILQLVSSDLFVRWRCNGDSS